MKYLRKFNEDAEVMNWRMSAEHVSPNVVLLRENILYNIPALSGVFIQHIDGTLYTGDDWSAGGFAATDANGVAVLTAAANFVIAKQQLDDKKWSSNTSTITNGILTTTDSAIAQTDLVGSANTQNMLRTDTSGAAYSCANFTFPNGAKGYLPAAGELSITYQYMSEINAMMSLIGGKIISTVDYFWSSTQYDRSKAWMIYWGSGAIVPTDKYKTNYECRAFAAI